jgi:glycosyltransferase involved in cell wall biosynthesis
MISVVLATYNEEKNIARCLDAVKKWADEIVIVDGTSSDDTVKIAKKYGARVVTTTNKSNFHINKQMAMDAAKGQLILQLDADEVVDDQLAKFITTTESQLQIAKYQPLPGLPVAWYIKRRNFFLGKFLTKGGQYPDAVIRLYIRGFAKLPQKDVHEQMTVDGLTSWADGHLLHYPNPNFATYIQKWDRYTSFKAEQLMEAQVKISLLNSWTYLFWKPFATWFSIFIRHKGFVDGIPGFVFALFSGLHHSMAYLKLWEKYQLKKTGQRS